MNDVSFVIQGKLNSQSINNIDNYLKYGKVIFSFYNDDDVFLSLKLKQRSLEDNRIKLVINNKPDVLKYNRQNIFLQGLTTLNGVKNADTPLVIKTRSDESFESFDIFIDNLIKNKDKFNTINFLFRKDSHYKFHPSDHLIASNKELLEKTFEILLSEYVMHENLPAEVKIFLSFLKAKEIDPDLQNSRQIMKENCVITNLRTFTNFNLKINCAENYTKTLVYKPEDLHKIEEDVYNINSLEDL